MQRATGCNWGASVFIGLFLNFKHTTEQVNILFILQYQIVNTNTNGSVNY